MTVSRRSIRLGLWLKVFPVVIAVGVLSGCVVEPAYGPGYYRGYGYSHPHYYRDRDDYYRRW